MKKRKRVISVVLIFVLIMSLNLVSAMAADASAFASISTSSIPYATGPNTYLITADSSMSWKKFNTIQGYDMLGTIKSDATKVEVFENRVGDTIAGKLNYSWKIDGQKCAPIVEANKGPIYLQITSTSIENGLSVKFKSKRLFYGEISIKLNVADSYIDGTHLTLNYVDGVDGSQIDGSNKVVPVIAATKVEGIVVEGGYIVFNVKNGGNYTLTKEAIVETPTIQAPTSQDAGIVPIQLATENTNTMLAAENADTTISTVKEADNSSPKTGSTEIYYVFIILMVISGVSISLLAKKKKTV
ncbi:LPXTG cell wall anchor domain-containing protein [[Clostridium] fimetarium]|uniref:LPXTG-motif cell wall anchor domain-containing protein n=1 Tax=[Clostridium] fimetarium TaxID=99656 RepID=A0A1I0RXL5_9FIRM|nr:LPXTG cell wall anchor domain-containing protein [[Clostridium] fimetarium]SEW46195.1 LPXTG-motif cell wall anchor domain-containing protein [[Clostridium] fimetarium]